MKKHQHMSKIEELAIEVGDRCNFKCDHCGVGEIKNLTLSSGEIELLIHSIEQYKFKEILFVGGETTLYIREINRIL
jgi:molybdenum cofactor biosynthesis enzyme MoaA